MRILVVDDDAMFRRGLRSMLESAGFSICEAPGGHAAVGIVRSEAPDVVLSDLYMPEGDGLELLHFVRVNRPGVRVIMMSGGSRLGTFDLLPAAKDLGASAVLAKPLRRESLLSTLGQLLHHSHCEQGELN